MVDAFLQHLDVRPTKASRVISVRFGSHDPELAAEVANAVVNAYTNRFIETKIAMAGKAAGWLNGQVNALREAVARSEKAVEAFRTQSGLLRGSQVTLISEEISEINRRLAAASADRAQATATLNEVRALQRANNIEAAQAIMESPVVQQLRIQEAAVLREFAELKIELGERHPKVINKKSELENLRTKIDAEMERVLKSYVTAVSVTTAREESLERELSRLKAKQALANSHEIELRELEREAEANRKLLENFLTRLKETTPQLDTEMQIPGATVLSPAAVPLHSLPDKRIVLTVSTVISLLLGFGLALMAERLDYGFRNAEQVTEATGLPVLAHLPTSRGGSGGPDAAILDSQPSLFLEGIRSTYIQLALRSKRPAIRSLLVTSSMPKEGKTTLAIGLTRTRATAGHRALLIDADLRRPSVHIRLKLEREPGLVDLLVGDASLEQVLQRDEPTGAFVIASGSTARDPSDLLGSKAFKTFLDQACGAFDLVVLDSSPLMSVSDACNLAPLAEETVFVIQWGKTGREVVKLALEKLTETEGVPRGVVLSRVDTAKIRLYGYGDAAYYDRAVREYYTRGSA
ncbi:MAG: polysaccharide biosynthesis tyrosine autokinase [Defluviicoccus sp.]|nr:polysaccharide biosynthesis tyrosine autokinase [Defluviicoccus sp.]